MQPICRCNSFAATPWRVLVIRYIAKNQLVSFVLDLWKIGPGARVDVITAFLTGIGPPLRHVVELGLNATAGAHDPRARRNWTFIMRL